MIDIQALYESGLSYTEIGKRFNPPKSKSAISGLMARYRKRHGLNVVRRVQKSTKTQRLDVLEAPPPSVTLPSFMAVLEQDTCRHITGDPKENPIFCGHKKFKKSYCEYHYKLCYGRENVTLNVTNT